MCGADVSYAESVRMLLHDMMNNIVSHAGLDNHTIAGLSANALREIDNLCSAADEHYKWYNDVRRVRDNDETIMKLRSNLFDGIWNDDQQDKVFADEAVDALANIAAYNMLEVERLQHYVDEQLRDAEYIKKFKAKVDEELLDEIQRRNDAKMRHCTHAIPWANLAINELMTMLRGANGSSKKPESGDSNG